jgi:hypothetical protein
MRSAANFFTDVIPALVEGISLHHCSATAAIGIIIHLFLFIQSEIPDLPAFNAKDIPFLCSSENGFTKNITNAFREKGHNINAIQPIHIPSIR